MLDSDYFLRKLEISDTVKNFKVGSQSFLPLKTFLQKKAKQCQQSSIAQPYVAVTGDKTIIGFVTLTCSEIDLQNGYDLTIKLKNSFRTELLNNDTKIASNCFN